MWTIDMWIRGSVLGSAGGGELQPVPMYTFTWFAECFLGGDS